MLGGCDGLERTGFGIISNLGGCGGVERTGFLTMSILGRCAGLERTDLLQFLLWAGVVVLKEMIFNSFYFGRMWWS